MTLKEAKAVFRVMQSLICELRSKVDDLESTVREIWEDASELQEEAEASAFMDDLTNLSDVLSNWEGDYEDYKQEEMKH